MKDKSPPKNFKGQTHRLLSEKEVSITIGISCSTLQKHRFRGIGIPYLKIGRLVRYATEDVIAFMESRKIITK